MSDEMESIACERCKECVADLDTPDGRWVCFGCYHAIFNELMRGVPAPLAWPGGRPTAAGRYWMRLKADHSKKTVWNVTEADVADPPIWFDLNEIAGPIPEPMEPPK